jgi:histidyl-tRNA synthetase
MNNIKKLIASTQINHGGVPAVDPRVEKMAKVIDLLIEKIIIYSKQTRNYKGIEYYTNIAFDAQKTLQQANEIAGEI